MATRRLTQEGRERVASARLRRDLTYREVAEKVRTTAEHIRAMERGEPVSLELIERVLALFGIQSDPRRG